MFLFSTLLATVDSTYTQDTTCTVYNFEVANTHNYFVGKDAVLVHNTCFEEIKAIVNASDYSDFTKKRLLELVEHNPNLIYRLLPTQNGTFNQLLFKDLAETVRDAKLYERVTEVNQVMKNNRSEERRVGKECSS